MHHRPLVFNLFLIDNRYLYRSSLIVYYQIGHELELGDRGLGLGLGYFSRTWTWT